MEIPIRNGVSIVGAIVWQASYNVRVHRGVVRVSTATDFLLLLKTEIPAVKVVDVLPVIMCLDSLISTGHRPVDNL